MSIPAIRKNPAPPPSASTGAPAGASAGASAPRPAPPSADQVRDSAISDISAARTNTRPRTPSWNRAADLVARTYEEGGSTAVHALLRRNPDMMRTLATGPADAIEDRMQEVAGRFDGANALEAVETFVSSAVRDGVATSAQRTIRGAIRGVEAQRTDILSNLERYQNAPANSHERQALAALGLNARSTAADVNRAADTTIDGLEGLHDRFEGQAWEVGDFPRTARATTGRMRLRAHMADTTLADRAVSETSGTAEAIAAGVLDFTHVGVDGYLIATSEHVVAGMVAIELGVLAAGLALGMVIHHGAEEVRNEAIELAHSLGI